MPRRSEDEELQLPNDPDYITLPTDRRKCRAERVPFCGEGSSSICSPVKEIKFGTLLLAQEEQETFMCAAHRTPLRHCPTLRRLLAMPSPVKKIQA
jgi:hypothetical protein